MSKSYSSILYQNTELACGLTTLGEASCWGNFVGDSNGYIWPLSLPYHASGGQFRTSKTRTIQIDSTNGVDAPFCGLIQSYMAPCRTLAYASVAPAATNYVPAHLSAVWSITAYQFVTSGSYPVSGFIVTLPQTTFYSTAAVTLVGTSGTLSFDVAAHGFGLQGVTVSGGTGVLIRESIVTAVFQSVTFMGQISLCGSAILSLFGSSSTITNCIFDSVQAINGGTAKDSTVTNLNGNGAAVALVYASTTIKSSIFRNNYAYGSGTLYVLSSSSTLAITSSSFTNNIAAQGAAIVSSLSGPLTITNTNFTNNAGNLVTFYCLLWHCCLVNDE
jgi:hypothetical protein